MGRAWLGEVRHLEWAFKGHYPQPAPIKVSVFLLATTWGAADSGSHPHRPLTEPLCEGLKSSETTGQKKSFLLQVLFGELCSQNCEESNQHTRHGLSYPLLTDLKSSYWTYEEV